MVKDVNADVYTDLEAARQAETRATQAREAAQERLRQQQARADEATAAKTERQRIAAQNESAQALARWSDLRAQLEAAIVDDFGSATSLYVAYRREIGRWLALGVRSRVGSPPQMSIPPFLEIVAAVMARRGDEAQNTGHQDAGAFQDTVA